MLFIIPFLKSLHQTYAYLRQSFHQALNIHSHPLNSAALGLHQCKSCRLLSRSNYTYNKTDDYDTSYPMNNQYSKSRSPPASYYILTQWAPA